jgi:hypothetical protein
VPGLGPEHQPALHQIARGLVAAQRGRADHDAAALDRGFPAEGTAAGTQGAPARAELGAVGGRN